MARKRKKQQPFRIAFDWKRARKVAAFFKDKKRLFLVFGLSLFFVLLFYGATLQNGFVHDDIGQVVRNEHVHSLSHLPKVVTSCIWKFELGDCITYYRPMQSLSYLLTWQISSNPFVFHLVQLLYVAAAVFAVFFLVYTLTKRMLLALLTALFFLIHPVNTEAINWISSLPDIAYTLFGALAFALYVSWTRNLPKGKRFSPSRNLKTAYRKLFESLRSFTKARLLQFIKAHRKLLLAALCYFVAMLSKEPAVLLPLLFLFFDAFIAKIPWKGFLHPSVVGRYILFGIPLFLYAAMRTAVLDGFGSGSGYYGIFSYAERVYAFVTLFGQYLAKLFAPYPLVFFYPFAKSSNFLNLTFLLSLFALIAFVVFFVWTIKTRRYLVGLFLLWFFIFLSPVLVALDSVGENVFSERYLFAPSVGFAFLLANGFVWLIQWKGGTYQKYAMGAIVILVAVSWAVVYERNKDWKDDFHLYAATIEQNPQALSIRRNLAVELAQEGRNDEAIAQLENILNQNPQWRDIDKVYNNLGDVWRRKGDFDTSLSYYEKFAQIALPSNFQPDNNIGATLLEKGEYLKSLLHICRAMAIDPAAPEPQRNIGRLVALFQSVSERNLRLLYDDVVKGGSFTKIQEERIKNIQKNCSDTVCSLDFALRLRSGEVILPFLIMGSSDKDEILRGKNLSFEQKTGVISLDLDARYKDEVLSFIFPTCEGVYYETAANSK